MDAFVASWSARGFSPVFIENATGVLERFLALLAVPAWEAGPDDVDAVVAQLVAKGMAASTRRGYVQAFKDFHRFLVVRKAAEIEATFGVHLVDPVDEFNASRHVGNDSPSTKAPPSPERMEEFFAFLRDRIATARKFGPAGRDYALFRTLYHAGLRADEAASLELADLHFGRGPFGKIHVRFGKGTRGSGPRPRWVPMLDQLDLDLALVRRRRPPQAARVEGFVLRRGRRRRSTGARSATGCVTCWHWKPDRPRSGSVRTACVTPARPTTTSEAWIWSPSSRCSAIGMWAPRCGM